MQTHTLIQVPSYYTPQQCPPVQPWFLVLWMVIFTGWMLTAGRKAYREAIDKEVEKRLAAMQADPSSQNQNQSFTLLEHQLIGMMHGDRAAAMRLVKLVREKHPGQSAQWCYEKAIADLERDRV